MPFYDLKCRDCGKEFNIMASMSDRERQAIKCPDCGSRELDQIFSNVNIIRSRKTGVRECPNIEKCGRCCH